MLAANEDDDDIINVGPHVSMIKPKKPQAADNIINIASNNRDYLTREQICHLFIEVATRPDHCFSFEMGFWLSKYETYTDATNFSEAALLIINAANIYGRKVDGLHRYILHIDNIAFKAVKLCEDTIKNAEKHKLKKAKQDKEAKEKEKKDKETTTENKETSTENENATKNKESTENIIINDDVIMEDVRFFEFESFTSICGTHTLETERVGHELMGKDEDISNIPCMREIDFDWDIDYENYVKLLNLRTLLDKRRKKRKKKLRKLPYLCNFRFMITSVFDDLELSRIKFPTWSFYGDDDEDEDCDKCYGDFTTFSCFLSVNFAMYINNSHCIKYRIYDIPTENRLVQSYCKKKNLPFHPLPIERQERELKVLLPPDYAEDVYDTKMSISSHYYDALENEIKKWNKLGPDNHNRRIRECTLIAYRDASIVIKNRNIIKQYLIKNWITKEKYINLIRELYKKYNVFKRDRFYRDIIVSKYFNDENDDYDFNIDEDDDDNETSLELGKENLKQLENITAGEELFSPNEIARKLITSELRISVDEGVDLCSPSRIRSPSLPRLSDLEPLERALLSPYVELVNIFKSLDSQKAKTLRINVKDDPIYSLLNINHHYFSNKSNCIKLEVPLYYNIFKLPEDLLRKKHIFNLPKDMRKLEVCKTNLKRKKNMLNTICQSNKLMKLSDLMEIPDDRNITSTPLSFEQDYDEFLGFDETIADSEKDRGIKSSRTFSNDSGICSPPHTMKDEHFTILPNNDIIEEEKENYTDLEDNEELLLATQRSSVQVIRKWHNFVRPIVLQSKNRSYFDIHAYGKNIIKTFPSQQINENKEENNDCTREQTVKETEKTSEQITPEYIDFNDVMRDKQKDFTARYFLSMLQLANSGNIEIQVQNKSNKKLTTFDELKLKLLDPVLNTVIMEEAQKIENFIKKKKTVQIGNNLQSSSSQPQNRIEKPIELKKNKDGKFIMPTSNYSQRKFFKEIKYKQLLSKSEKNPFLADLNNLTNSNIDQVINLTDKLNHKLLKKRAATKPDEISDYSSNSELDYVIEPCKKRLLLSPSTTTSLKSHYPSEVNRKHYTKTKNTKPVPKINILPNVKKKIVSEEENRTKKSCPLQILSIKDHHHSEYSDVDRIINLPLEHKSSPSLNNNLNETIIQYKNNQPITVIGNLPDSDIDSDVDVYMDLTQGTNIHNNNSPTPGTSGLITKKHLNYEENLSAFVNSDSDSDNEISIETYLKLRNNSILAVTNKSITDELKLNDSGYSSINSSQNLSQTDSMLNSSTYINNIPTSIGINSRMNEIQQLSLAEKIS